MKELAFWDEEETQPILIDEVGVGLKEDPVSFERRTYFWLGLKVKGVFRKGKKASFAYMSAPPDGHRRGGKGIVHDLVQHYLWWHATRIGIIRVLIDGQQFTLEVEKAELEVGYRDPGNGRRVCADVVFHLRSTSEAIDVFGQSFIVEVTDQHACPRVKIRFFEENNLTALELVLKQRWHVPNGVRLKKDEIDELQKQLMRLAMADLRLRVINWRKSY